MRRQAQRPGRSVVVRKRHDLDRHWMGVQEGATEGIWKAPTVRFWGFDRFGPHHLLV